MKITIAHVTLTAALGFVATACHSKGAVAVNPVGIVRGPSGVVYVLGASGRLAKCSSNAACEIVK